MDKVGREIRRGRLCPQSLHLLTPAHVATKEVARIKVKLHDKVKALDSLARHLRMFEKDNQVGISDTFAAILEATNRQGLGPPSERVKVE